MTDTPPTDGLGVSCCMSQVHPITCHDVTVEQRYSSTLSLTSALDGGLWLTPRPSRFTPGKETRYPFCMRLGGPQGRSGRVRKISPPLGFDPRTVQPVASSHTDYAILAHAECNLPSTKNWGTRWRRWFRHCATSRKVAGSIPDGVIRIFH